MMTPSRSRSGHVGLIKIRPPLDADEEARLQAAIAAGRRAAERLAAGTPTSPTTHAALRSEIRRGRAAEEELLAGTCGLVKQRVAQLGFRMDRDDLEAAALEGLVTALRRFDPTKGARFATYANYWIQKMVLEAISHRVPYPESDVRLVIQLRRLLRRSSHTLTTEEVARHLRLTRTEAARIMSIDHAISQGTEDVDEKHVSSDAPPWPEAEWIIDGLKEILGGEFEDFWLWTGRVMSLEELGRRHGISKQAMAKRVQRWRRLVEQSPRADEMLQWLRAQ